MSRISLDNLKPGTEEYKKVETELIRRICDADLGDESRFLKAELQFKITETRGNADLLKEHLKRLEKLHKQSSIIHR
jgi:hypothetical protein